MSELFTKQVLTVGEMASGVSLTIPVYRLKGNGQGPSVYIQANIHGAEVQGNAVIYQLLELLQKQSLLGDITLVPYANPVGCNHKNGEYTLGRFDPITGVNWNRMFHHNEQLIEHVMQKHSNSDVDTIKQYFQQLMLDDIEQKLDHNNYGLSTGRRIAYRLQQLAHQHDIVLDLHTGPISSKHIYCPEYARNSASFFNIPHTILIPNDFAGAMDEATFCPWWTLAEKFAENGRELDFGKESFTVELGSQELIDLDEALYDAKSILSYLQYKQVIASDEFVPQNITRYGCYLKDYKIFYSPMGGMVDYLAQFGEELKAGSPLARILRMDNYGDGDALHYIQLEEDAIPILHFASASVNLGTELYKVFTNYFEL
ncbi:succinylglutamate desuccinylase/aspartoacylase family protein [Thalassotalea sp. Y01]|uniref:succinylglutamate desuccinylase/aspartoacylase family protein n=1 Tax=Thalassotalea sp. Y01 TaxID=2729613 RepID=UPI00145CC74D|nr:succinylglutamate desuccinylase/aspartoacylase family protein [Thalassotalea sp. Y01]NMP15930.1 succinylglutamate desuccinylase/aspartoacylase family protein [Thalassotalea sp. Y01]